MKAKSAICPMCSQGTLRPEVVNVTTHVGTMSFRDKVPAKTCDSCGEVLTEILDHIAVEARVAGRLVLKRVSTPEAFKFIRVAGLDMTSQAFAATVGATPETVSRWENGRVPITGSAFELLRVLTAKRLSLTYDTMDFVESLLKAATRARARGVKALPRVAAARGTRSAASRSAGARV